MKKQQLLVINYLLRLKAIIFASLQKAEEQLNNTTDDNLFLGSGRKRKHAFAWKMIQSPLCDTLFCCARECWNRSNSNKCQMSASLILRP
jgi:phosphoribosylamine--glycine ligase